MVQGSQPQRYLRKNFLLTGVLQPEWDSAGRPRARHRDVQLLYGPIFQVLVLTTFQTQSEHVPGTVSCHPHSRPHSSVLVGSTVNVGAATITTCIAMIITTARNTVPLPPHLHLHQQYPVLAHGGVTATGSLKSHSGCTADLMPAGGWGSRSFHSAGMAYNLEGPFLETC